MNTQKLNFDDGMIRLDVNGNGFLVFNPSDLNLYDRFYAFAGVLPDIEKRYAAEVEGIPEGTEQEQAMELAGQELARAKAYDAEVKAGLSAVFGADNDFDKLLGGVNLMSFGQNGQRVITNLLNALQPYIEKGVRKYTAKAVREAKANREQRRAWQKKQNRKPS